MKGIGRDHQEERGVKNILWGRKWGADLSDDFVDWPFGDEEFFKDVGETVAACAEDDEEVTLHSISGAVILASNLCQHISRYREAIVRFPLEMEWGNT